MTMKTIHFLAKQAKVCISELILHLGSSWSGYVITGPGFLLIIFLANFLWALLCLSKILRVVLLCAYVYEATF